ncbi:OpcA protein [Citricoccus sp. SGAir0253]|uniref:glucose-6-phosphate dehydrogenase assembly protein OpcA n=1 Tax=Citricoccus sp. SGAir0253 TaxID=2567881 RepID=UPI0010CD4351|nr:glucose-6-phosphate dehydrogenase assembly protein OpcA [Citricoccus sp. SGAir0253]QCU78116.1 OpcA protein [Citricoccus sp. SGAir0253]
MIIDLKDTTTSRVAKEMNRLREAGGVVALGRVLTLIISTSGDYVEHSIRAANLASREHPCRIIVIAAGDPDAPTALDAQIRVGGDAGASDVVVLHGSGSNAVESESLIGALLLPDAPIVVWWPHDAPAVPADSSLGRIAHRRITDTATADVPRQALMRLRQTYRAGDTDLSWTRLTGWRIQLAAILDTLDPAEVRSVTVDGAEDSPSTLLLAAWLTRCLAVPVTMAHADAGRGMRSVRLRRDAGDIVLSRPVGDIASLYQQGRPIQHIPLPRRSDQDCLAEELRRLDPDEVFGDVVTNGLPLTDLKAVLPSDR